MNNWTWLIVGLTVLYGLMLEIESLQAKADRKKIKHIVHVNGTRGKSTVTRLIDAGLREGGLRVVCKSTGTLPVIFHTDRREEEIQRKAPANVREQLKVMHIAAEEQADVLVIECMALDPKLQWACQNQMLRADIGVITNARIDHTDVMGETLPEILSAMMEMLPKNGKIYTAEKRLFSMIEAKAEKLGSTAELAEADDVDTDIDFPENVALALKVCMGLGVSRETALKGMQHYIQDPFSLEIFRKGNMIFVNALSTNDVTSAEIVYQQADPERSRELWILINNRQDRPARAREMVRLCCELRPQKIFILGEQQNAVKLLCEKKLPETEIELCTCAGEVPLEAGKPVLLLAVGNIKNEGIVLSQRVRTTMGIPVNGQKRGETGRV